MIQPEVGSVYLDALEILNGHSTLLSPTLILAYSSKTGVVSYIRLIALSAYSLIAKTVSTN